MLLVQSSRQSFSLLVPSLHASNLLYTGCFRLLLFDYSCSSTIIKKNAWLFRYHRNLSLVRTDGFKWEGKVQPNSQATCSELPAHRYNFVTSKTLIQASAAILCHSRFSTSSHATQGIDLWSCLRYHQDQQRYDGPSPFTAIHHNPDSSGRSLQRARWPSSSYTLKTANGSKDKHPRPTFGTGGLANT